jgi:hypothetical protein
MSEKSFLHYLISYLLVIIVILQSGTNLFYGFSIGYLLPIVFFIKYFYFSFEKRIESGAYIFLGITFLLMLYHYFDLNTNFKSEIIQYLIFVTVFFIISILGFDFLNIFLRITIFLAISSLLIWVLLQFSGAFKTILISFGESLPKFSGSSDFFYLHKNEASSVNAIIYNVSYDDSIRNYGIFYEPGRFAIFLIIALLLNVFHFGKTLFNKTSIILMITTFTTFSTTGYIAILLIILFYGYSIKIHPFLKFVILILLIFLIYYLLKLDFMLDKINAESTSDSEDSRFFAFVYHLEMISKKPISGYGITLTDILLSPNGISFFVLKYGVPYFLYFLFFLYKSTNSLIKSLNFKSRLFILAIFLVLAFSQTVMDDPLYLSFIFLGNFKR